MDITFNCHKCQQPLTIDDAGAGSSVACPQCASTLTVPARPVATKKCSYCMEEIAADAKLCPLCSYDLVTGQFGPRPVPVVLPATRSNPLPKVLAVLVIIALLVAGFIVHSVWQDHQKVSILAAAKAAVDYAHWMKQNQLLDTATTSTMAKKIEHLQTLSFRASESLDSLKSAGADLGTQLTDFNTDWDSARQYKAGGAADKAADYLRRADTALQEAERRYAQLDQP